MKDATELTEKEQIEKMATTMDGVLRPNLQNAIHKSKVLVVGAGGIGCEILKNLVLTGFSDIEIIDLDTIDVSNLNRQFLFQKQHVGKSKAAVARETALSFNPKVNIIHHHASITTTEYGLAFFKKFSLVMNALDNRAARNHVNRMCLAADVPLIESGTAGYEGQVELIKKGFSQCYECMPKAAQKTFPGCTIRNTPSEPIHCIVWSKHLFNQLFGEEDPDQDVSPDTADPEAADTAGEEALQTNANEQGNVERVSTRSWAQSCGYDPEKLFSKLFHDDIKYLLSMDNLWKKRRPPNPLEYNNLPDEVAGCSKDTDPGLKDQQQWSIARCAEVFAGAVRNLSRTLKQLQETNPSDHLVWDKDDQDAMDFVAACANIRAYIFGIAQKSRFDIKSMAGNIIPAIATTNAIIAGVVVLHAFRILQDDLKSCRSVYLRQKANHRNQLLVPEKYVNPPNPKCYVCAPTPQACLAADTTQMTIKELEESVMKAGLNMIAPDVMIDGKGTVVISSEEGETEQNNDKILKDLGIVDGAILKVDDFLQNYSLTVTVTHRDKPAPNSSEPDFLIVADEKDLVPKEEKAEEITNGKDKKEDEDDDDIIMEEVIENDVTVPAVAQKRKTIENEVEISTPSKKPRLSSPRSEANNVSHEDDDDVCVIEDDDEEDDDCVQIDSHNNKEKLSRFTEDSNDCLIVYDDQGVNNKAM